MNIAVTWLLPTRNASRFLPVTLRSIAAQTHQEHSVLAWDNGSSDGTVEILRNWIPKKIPGRVVVDSPFDSLGACLRAMVETADSELLARIDADDIAYPDRLLRQVRTMASRPDLAGCGCQEERIDEAGRVLPRTCVRYTDSVDVRFALLYTNPVPHPGVMLRKSAVLRAGNYRAMGMGQDLDLWFRLTETGPIVQTSKPLVKYRVHAASVSGKSREQWGALHLELLERYRESLFPGASSGEIEQAAKWAKRLASPPGTATEAVDTLVMLAQYASRAPAWRNADFVASRALRDAVWRVQPGRLGSLRTKAILALSGRVPAVKAFLPQGHGI